MLSRNPISSGCLEMAHDTLKQKRLDAIAGDGEAFGEVGKRKEGMWVEQRAVLSRTVSQRPVSQD